MKILHCCLANFYIDDFGYQENTLPKIHKHQGYEVQILASTETYINKTKLGYIEPSVYVTKEGIPITRIPYVNWLPHFLAIKIRLYEGVLSELNSFKPDIIFLHDCQFLSIKVFAEYAKNNNVSIYVDGHADFINSGRNWVSKNILHKIFYRYCVKSVEKIVKQFYGTLPIRNTFFKEVYGIDPSKVSLLPFGADDTLFNISDRAKVRKEIRSHLNISEQEFVLISGGKIDRRKNIHLLLDAVRQLKEKMPDLPVTLIVFGKPNDEMKVIVEDNLNLNFVKYLEWLPPQEIHKYIFASDLGVFPGTHSVLWEEATGMGLPCIFRKWEGIEHVDLGGNCRFIEGVDIREELKHILLKLTLDSSFFRQMEKISREKGPEYFTYTKIAARAISSN